MLQQFKDLLNANALLIERDIKDVPTSCCNAISTSVLSFDEVTNIFYTIKRVPFAASVDAIYFDIAANKLFFIEITSYQDYIRRNHGGTSNLANCQEFINKQIETHEIYRKIIGSFFTITNILTHYGIDVNFYPYFLNRDRLDIAGILLTDISDGDFIKLQIANFTTLRTFTARHMCSSLSLMNC